ncbi:DUF4249 domain-containing protein [Algoriphagus sp. D3-2-R+10]|uniref:DUF4249 domain-containing protein n=1 Tax=Algoriphagus aurantiacus TaxID=3103948 RepID=UPI002B3AA729|nr:DUF4249 domain-containing protein [Algoriphagus sp. D3-2-R+10]MEB2778671.1 DUF4249 domain-containing protein [Algoriphagus sp. D3-2-R+10]
MKKILNIFHFSYLLNLAWIILISSCIDRLDFIGDTKEGQIIIYGLLSAGENIHTVNVGLSRSSGFTQSSIPNAEVNLLVQEGGTYRYTSIGDGNYELHNFNPVEGQSYSLEVMVGEKVYRSTFQEIPSSNGVDSLSYDVAYEPFRTTFQEHVFKVYSKTRLPENDEPVYLRWIVEETAYWELVWIYAPGIPPPLPPPCFIFDIMEPAKINLFDGSSSKTQTFDQLLATRKIDNSFLFPMFISVKQLSINRDAYEYWEKIKTVIENQGSLFDIPPAPIIGNIKNTNDPNEKVLGFFEVAKSQVTRFYVTSEISPVYLPPPCFFVLGKPRLDYPAECLTCEDRALGRKFVMERPDWWVYD